MAYKLISNDKNARAGLLSINNIEVQTPTFMPVATRGAIKSTPHQYLDKTSILLANAYHLHLRPGAQLINNLGGLHKFMNWDKLILTDSGGFQAWSLPTKLLNDGIEFKNVYDGSFFKMTPEESINTQNLLGSDIAMIFDYLIDYDRSDDDQMKAIEITSQWAEKAKSVHKNNKQDLFGIVQGGLNLDLRETSAKSMIELDFDGYAIGGLAIGETSTERKKIVEHLNSILPIDINCKCFTCLNYSRAYLRHLFANENTTSWLYLTVHNIIQTEQIIEEARESILNSSFDSFKKEFINE